MTPAARHLLRERGAATLPHPGGTLLAHLERVHRQLTDWHARPALQLAGLCHAFYGTDGFPHPLQSPDERTPLTSGIGTEAESIVYFYAACDRATTYPALTSPTLLFTNRFTGRTHTPTQQKKRDFAELTAANELDLARLDPAFRDRHGPGLLTLFTGFRPLLTPAAWQDCVAVLDAPRH